MHNHSYLIFIFLLSSYSIYAQQDSIIQESKQKQFRLFKKQPKTTYKDSIKLINNDILVGEIKSMDKSVLILKTKYSDSDFKIKWHKVSEIYSNRVFIISLADGQRMYSSINSDSTDKGKVMLDAGEQSFNTALKSVVFLEPIGKSFISRLSVDVDFGVSLTKANNLKQFNSNINATYIANKWSSDGYFKSVLSRQDDIADIKRIDGKINAQYFLQNDWFVQASAIYLANDEQLLKLRSTYKGGLGYYFVKNNTMYLGASGGLAWTIEDFTDNSPTKNSGELYLGVGFNKYDIGDLSLLTSVVFFPSLTEQGRYRTDFNFDMKYDLPLDFFIKMSISYNFDNKPIDGAAKDDYVFTTSFGWEFN